MRTCLLLTICLPLVLTPGCQGDDDDATDDDVADDDATADDDTTADDDDDTSLDDDDSSVVSDDDSDPGDDDTTAGDDDDTTAGDDDDTVPSCGTVGQMCTDPSPCDSGETCFIGGAGGVCAPNRDGCGGFAGAMCNDPAAPICMYLESADYGLCASAFEKDCICNTSPAVMEPSAC